MMRRTLLNIFREFKSSGPNFVVLFFVVGVNLLLASLLGCLTAMVAAFPFLAESINRRHSVSI